MAMRIGTIFPTNFKIGATQVTALYQGATRVWPMGGGTLVSATYLNTGVGSFASKSGIELNIDGWVYQIKGSNSVALYRWMPEGEQASNYSVYFDADTTASGGTVAGTFNAWTALSASRQVSVTDTAVGNGSPATNGLIVVHLRYDPTGEEPATANIYLHAQAGD